MYVTYFMNELRSGPHADGFVDAIVAKVRGLQGFEVRQYVRYEVRRHFHWALKVGPHPVRLFDPGNGSQIWFQGEN